MVEKKQINVRLSADACAQLASLTNYFRAQYPIGRIARDTVLGEIIRMAYEQMVKNQKEKGSAVYMPTVAGLKESKSVGAGPYRIT